NAWRREWGWGARGEGGAGGGEGEKEDRPDRAPRRDRAVEGQREDRAREDGDDGEVEHRDDAVREDLAADDRERRERRRAELLDRLLLLLAHEPGRERERDQQDDDPDRPRKEEGGVLQIGVVEDTVVEADRPRALLRRGAVRVVAEVELGDDVVAGQNLRAVERLLGERRHGAVDEHAEGRLLAVRRLAGEPLRDHDA